MSELSRTQIPPGGWQFFQPQTGWSNPHPVNTTFDQTVVLIIKMRQKNPAICLRHGLSTDPGQVGKELEMFTRRRLGLPIPQPPPPSSLIPGMGAMAGAPISEIRRLANGAALLVGWETSNLGAVDAKQAEARAAVCAACPQNNLAKFEQWPNIPVAAAVKAKTPRLTALKLSTQLDAKLGVCETVFCPNRQLVFAPEELLKKRVKEIGALDANCWIRKP